jgi:signal transduction histidine kinase
MDATHLSVAALLAAAVAATVLAWRRSARLEATLRQARVAREQFTEAIQSIDEGFALFGPDERLLLINRAMERMHPGLVGKLVPGTSAEEVLKIYAQSGATELLDPEDAAWFAERMAAYRKPEGSDRVVRARDGRWFRFIIRPTPSGGRVLVHVDYSAARDREERLRRVTSALERTGNDLDAALSNIVQGVCLFDAEARLILANRRYIELYNLPAERIVPGISMVDIMRLSVAVGNYPAERGEQMLAERMAVVAARERRTFTQALASGRVVEVVHQPLPTGGFVATYADITERQRTITELRAAKEAAEDASRAKSQFLATMSHELRTPLNAIIGFSEMIAGETYGPAGSPRYVEYARDIRRSGVHLLDLINGILDTAKIEAGRYVLQEESVDAGAIVEVCLAMLRPHADEAKVKLVVEVDPDLPPLWVDRRAIVQVLLNLLSNAVKFTPAGGRVEIAAVRAADGGGAYRVVDTGVGIPAATLDQLFEPFVQGDPTLSRRHPGTGLGLAISRSLMALHGGSLTLESTPGQGTIARAAFPPHRLRAEAAVKS